MVSAFETTVSATKFKATCLDLIDRLHDGKLRRVHITKRGKPHLTMMSERAGQPPQSIFGALKGMFHVPEGLDLTEPVIDLDDIEAMKG